MPDDNIDYRIMYPDRNWKSRKRELPPERKPKRQAETRLRPEKEKTSETPSRSYVDKSARAIRDRVREIALADPTLRSPEVTAMVNRDLGVNVSGILVSAMLTEFRATLRFLDARGHLKGITLQKGDGAAKR